MEGRIKYRMYVDEVGNSDLEASTDPNHRYLSLTGVIIDLDYVRSTLFPTIENMKQEYFGSHPDNPIILHRKRIINKRHPFEILRNNKIERKFNKSLLNLISDFEYVIITATIDKLEHRQRYKKWRFDPYHYCLAVIVERFVMWLKKRNFIGDVLAESRGGKEDLRLKNSFSSLLSRGSTYMTPDEFEEVLTSCELKVKPKSNNISGLQLADLLAHPSFRASLARRQKRGLPNNFGGKIAKILEDSKYDRSPNGKVDGFGRTWLP